MRASEYPHPESAAVTAVMRGNRSRDTKPEVSLRSELHRLGLRFRKDYKVTLADRRVKVDIAFPRPRLAVFVDGCWWHSCPDHGRAARRNEHYWGPKFERNRLRDEAVNRGLTEMGWTVLRIWEHVPPGEAALEVAAALGEELPT